jgi:hypothetical protein
MHTLDILSSSENKDIRVDLLATLLCQRVGHKKYKQLLKPYKSFQRFLSENADHLSVRPSDQISIDLVSSNGIGILSEEESDADALSAEMCFTSSEKSISKLTDERIAKLFSVRPEIEFIEGDIFEFSWWEFADVVYVASLLFSDEMMHRLSLLAAKMKPGSHLISLKPLFVDDAQSLFAAGSVTIEGERSYEDDKTNRKLIMISESFFKMSWQMAKVYIYRIDA